MTAFPRAPRLLKGAIVALDSALPTPSVIVFQYNPESLRRRLDARATGQDTRGRTDPLKLLGPPQEAITLEIVLDATDGLEIADPIATRSGVGSALAALEILLYPKTQGILKSLISAKQGALEVVPAEAPLTLFVWGPQRVIPVRLLGFDITEEAYDTSLNPILARVQLSLTVLSTLDLPTDNPGYSLYVAHQTAKEALAQANPAQSAEATGVAIAGR